MNNYFLQKHNEMQVNYTTYVRNLLAKYYKPLTGETIEELDVVRVLRALKQMIKLKKTDYNLHYIISVGFMTFYGTDAAFGILKINNKMEKGEIENFEEVLDHKTELLLQEYTFYKSRDFLTGSHLAKLLDFPLPASFQVSVDEFFEDLKYKNLRMDLESFEVTSMFFYLFDYLKNIDMSRTIAMEFVKRDKKVQDKHVDLYEAQKEAFQKIDNAICLAEDKGLLYRYIYEDAHPLIKEPTTFDKSFYPLSQQLFKIVNEILIEILVCVREAKSFIFNTEWAFEVVVEEINLFIKTIQTINNYDTDEHGSFNSYMLGSFEDS